MRVRRPIVAMRTSRAAARLIKAAFTARLRHGAAPGGKLERTWRGGGARLIEQLQQLRGVVRAHDAVGGRAQTFCTCALSHQLTVDIKRANVAVRLCT